MEIEIPNGYKAEWVNGILTLVQDKKEDLRPITERVKTFEDAVAELGGGNPLCVQYFEMYDNFLFESGDAVADIVAYLKLRIIAAALNEGWTPQFAGNEQRYSLMFSLCSEEKLKRLPKSFKRYRGVMLDGDVYAGVNVGIISMSTNEGAFFTDAYFGSRLCFKTEALAVYAGKQFASLWLDLYYHPNTKCKPYFSE